MKRRFILFLALIVALLPASGIAEGLQPGRLYTARAGSFTLDLGDGEPVTLDIALEGSLARGQEPGEGEASLSVYSGETLALMAAAALKGGEVRAHLNGMKNAWAVTEEQAKEIMAQATDLSANVTGSSGESVPADPMEMLNLLGDYVSEYKAVLQDPEATRKIAEAQRESGMYDDCTAAGPEEVQVLGETYTLNRFDVRLDLLQFMEETVPELFQNVPELDGLAEKGRELLRMAGEESDAGWPEIAQEAVANLRAQGVLSMTADVTLWTSADAPGKLGDIARAEITIRMMEEKRAAAGDSRQVEENCVLMTSERIKDDSGEWQSVSCAMNGEALTYTASVSDPAADENGRDVKTVMVDLVSKERTDTLELSLTCSSEENEDRSAAYETVLWVEADGETYSLSAQYTQDSPALDGETETVAGRVTLSAQGAEAESAAGDRTPQTIFAGSLSFDTALISAPVPEGGLLDGSLPAVYPLEMTEEEQNRAIEEIRPIVLGGVSVLFRADGVMELVNRFGGLM